MTDPIYNVALSERQIIDLVVAAADEATEYKRQGDDATARKYRDLRLYLLANLPTTL